MTNQAAQTMPFQPEIFRAIARSTSDTAKTNALLNAAREIERLTAALAQTAGVPSWIVNDLGELGVMVNGVAYFLYKGDNIVYEDAKHDDGSPMLYRMVGKREFGEVCRPRHWEENGWAAAHRYTQELVYTPGLSFGKPEDGNWRPLPTQAAAPAASGGADPSGYFINGKPVSEDYHNGFLDGLCRSPGSTQGKRESAAPVSERACTWPDCGHDTNQVGYSAGCTGAYCHPNTAEGSSPIYAAYLTWPEDIRRKLSIHDLRRMHGWAPRPNPGDWRIDTSAGGPILVYQDCSVIEGEQARYVLGLIAKDTALEQALTQQRGEVAWTHDAESWGNALNEAAWIFVDQCPEKSALLFNNAKAPLRAAILKYAELVGAATTPQPSADAVRELVAKWRGIAETNFAQDRLDKAIEISMDNTLRDCADELESLLSAASGEKGVGS